MTDYHTFVQMIAENALEMGESPRTAARACTIYPERVGDEQTVLFGAEPFVNDAVSQTRLWPKDIITGTDREWSHIHGDTLREIAVEILKADLNEAMMEIENETLARAEIEAERKLDERRERHFDRHGHFGPGHDPGPD